MILMYHKVDARSPTMWWVDAATFNRQMAGLAGYKVVYLDDYDPGDPTHVAITFDGVYRNVLQYAAPILKRYGYPFELFLSSDFVGKDNEFDLIEPREPFSSESELARLVALGGRLQWHTRSHPRLEQSRRDSDWKVVDAELTVPEEIRSLDPSGFGWFAYPYGAFSDDVCDEVARRFAGAVSCDQGNDHDRYRLNRITVTNSTRFGRTVCLVIVSHNYGEFLCEAIESALQQTCPPDSVLIMDDCSSDTTESIGTRYARLYPGLITYHRNEQRLGIVDTFNRAVALTESDCICFLGADNRLSSDYVEQCLIALAGGDDKRAIAYTDFLLFGPNARDEYWKHASDRRGRIIDDLYYEVSFPEFSRAAMLEGNFIHGSAMYLRSAFLAVGGYRSAGEGRPEDANLFRRMVSAGFGAAKAAQAKLEYRQHSSSQANIVSRTQGELAFYRAYSRRLEFKVKALEMSFGVLSPFVRLASMAEKAMFELAVRVVRAWRRLF